MEQDGVTANYIQLTTCGCTESGNQCRGQQCRCMKSSLWCTYACASTHSLSCVNDWCKNPFNNDKDDKDDDNDV